MSAAPCVFCNGALANERLTQSPRWLALTDGYPVSPGHALVVPRRHVVSLFDLTAVELMEAFGLLAEARALIDAAYRPDGYNIGINDGRAAGRTVHHLHIHLIPRYQGDVPDPRGGVRLILPGPSPDLWGSREVGSEQSAGGHVYLSTGCLHGDHGYCRSTRQGGKIPAECKFCAAPCICHCHQAAPTEPADQLARSDPAPMGLGPATSASAGEPNWREDDLGAYDARVADALTEPVPEEPRP